MPEDIRNPAPLTRGGRAGIEGCAEPFDTTAAPEQPAPSYTVPGDQVRANAGQAATIGPPNHAAADPDPDPAAIRSHVEMLHALAERGDCDGRLVINAFGEDPDRQDPKSGKPGLKLSPKVAHFAIGKVEGMVAAIECLSRLPNYNVYAPLTVYRHTVRSRSRGTAKDIAAVLGLVADFDDAEAARWQERLPLEPQLALETSAGRFQAFYLFDKPQPPAAVEALAKRLSACRNVCESTSRNQPTTAAKRSSGSSANWQSSVTTTRRLSRCSMPFPMARRRNTRIARASTRTLPGYCRRPTASPVATGMKKNPTRALMLHPTMGMMTTAARLRRAAVHPWPPYLLCLSTTPTCPELPSAFATSSPRPGDFTTAVGRRRS